MARTASGDEAPARLVRFAVDGGRPLLGELYGDAVRADGVAYRLQDIEFLPPVSPTKLVCVGMNYVDHAEELKAELPKEPLLFLKPPSSIVAHGDAIVRPAGVERLDYEGELCVAIGRRAKNVSRESALEYIAGLTIANDVTAREYQLPGSQWTRAKGYDTFAPIGPCLLESKEWSGRAIETWVNGVRVQSSSTDRLVFDVPTLISYATGIMTLEPGDLLLTGTPSGVGSLEDGDTVEIAIEGIGLLRNHVEGSDAAAEAPSSGRVGIARER